MFALSAILILHRWGLDEERSVERRRRMGTLEAHSAKQAANLTRSNRALAIGLGSFAVLVLFVALTSAVLYDHELGPAGDPFGSSAAPPSSAAVVGTAKLSVPQLR
jgi:putative membrane protein